ncbi:MAG TPA: endonuclease/exonuclease/phosphatase family protein [Acetobacteraceae bacterium]|nr:endonuclease/exonuclease/phosphatase family protein [Acetobacteraceae bacterium]
MRLLTWNIRQGGGSRLERIAAALLRHDADVLVLTEYRGGEAGRRLRELLNRLGYAHLSGVVPPPGRNGVLIAARDAFDGCGLLCAELPEPWKIVEADFAGFSLAGVYMPNLRKKVPYWQALMTSLTARAARPMVAIGDFNTCRAYLDEAGATDLTAHFMDAMEAIGFVDVWRRRYPDGREYSWFSTRGNGFRIDHAFCSIGLAGLVGDIRYAHHDRISGISDHAPLILDLRPS